MRLPERVTTFVPATDLRALKRALRPNTAVVFLECPTNPRLFVPDIAKAARLAHEVKNPLGAIKGAAQLLAEPSPGASELDPTSREFLGIILEEVDRLDRVVGSVLDYARPAKGHPAPIDLNGIVKRTVQIFFSERDTEISIAVVEIARPTRTTKSPVVVGAVWVRLPGVSGSR